MQTYLLPFVVLLVGSGMGGDWKCKPIYCHLYCYWWYWGWVATGNTNLFNALCTIIVGVGDGWGHEMQTYLLPFVLLLVGLGMGGN